MRWQKPNKHGLKRIVREFLFLPKCINGEYRWMESVTYEQKYDAYNLILIWEDIRWIN